MDLSIKCTDGYGLSHVKNNFSRLLGVITACQCENSQSGDSRCPEAVVGLDLMLVLTTVDGRLYSLNLSLNLMA